MRNEEISNETKNRMADALKQLLSTKSPEKITVKDITTLANVSRPTFYYHFKDLHALTEFMFNRELTDLLKGHCEGDSLSDAVLIILRFLKKNTAFCTTISEGVGYSELSLLFDGCIEDMISQYTHHLNEQIGAKEAALRLSQEYGIPYGEKVPQGRGLIKRRPETEEQRFRRMEKKCFRILSDYYHLLLRWKEQEAPQTPEEEWSEHFTESLMRLGTVEYQMDLLLSGDLAERAEFIAEQGKEVMALERRMAELAAGDKKEGGTRHGRDGAGHER